MSKKKGLGRGLEHLIAQNIELNNEESSEVIQISLEEIKANKYQPRKVFNDDGLKDLAASIKEQGVFQPILVRKAPVGYEIISGERRFRASKLAGKTEIPAIIYNYSEEQIMQIALIENIQREDLSIIEEANSYAMLIERLGLTQTKLAEKIGKSRSHITNTLSLLKLPEEVIELLSSNKITMGHAKVLVGLSDEAEILTVVDTIMKEQLSVRDTEKLVKSLKADKEPDLKSTSAKKKVKTKKNNKIENLISEKLDTRVKVKGNEKGTIEITFKSEDDLERLLELLKII